MRFSYAIVSCSPQTGWKYCLSETMQSVGSQPYGISCIWGTEYLGSFHTDLVVAQLQHGSKYAFFDIFVTPHGAARSFAVWSGTIGKVKPTRGLGELRRRIRETIAKLIMNQAYELRMTQPASFCPLQELDLGSLAVPARCQ